MLFNKDSDNVAARLELGTVEATDESIAVYLSLTNQDETTSSLSIDSTKPLLFDPVGGRVYPLMADGPVDRHGRFEVTGKGSSEPVAKEGGENDEEARKRNRRVELSYEVTAARNDKNGNGSDSGSGIAAAERHVALPAS
ncbi:hypothetical protein [Nocardiopsis rhodophaea]|uniref:hypothetical protein n=1 Tax=Nocardiopsis rhodophaea TaxID=280238 RepID=UPI0031D8C663